MSPRKVPHIIGMMGNCFGDPTWQATNSEFVVQVKGTCMAVSGPRVLGVALEERTTPEELGGWKVHAEVTGQVDAFAEDDAHCAQIIRDIISYVPSNCEEEPPYVPSEDPPDRKLDQLLTLIPGEPNEAYDMHPVIEAMVDDGRYLDLKPYFGKALATCLARMNGRVVGIIASQTTHNAGALGPDECDKATKFIVVCDSFNIPLVFLVDTPGFLVGGPSEERRITTKMMTWLQALTYATVPKITVVVGKAWGMAAANMCGANTSPDFLAALTTADIRSTSPEAALNVLCKRRIEEAENPGAERGKLLKEMESMSGPWYAAGSGVLDDAIDPRDMRRYIIDHLDILRAQRGDFIGEHRLQTWPCGF
jgi:acetyl-CoA carboxylase carboxyltransferase component